MHAPIPHDLNIYSGKCDFEKHRFCPHQWEISVPQKNCIIWGVVLSYLRSADFTAFGKFEERLNRLTENAFNPESVKKAILGFNPFFNIHKCFFNETLQKVTLSFKKFLDKNRPMPKSVPQDIQMISTLLQSNILIVDHEKQSLHLVEPSNGDCADVATITLFCREYWSKDKTQLLTKRFTFCLNMDLCWELRQEAFAIILRQLRSGESSTEIKGITQKEIQTLGDQKHKKINILIYLLKRDGIQEIFELYDSPYTIAKLADAGFETDPRLSDEKGYSAFYYALQSSDNDLVYLLYKYAANSCYESEKSFRDPNPCIISNFSDLKKILNGDCELSSNFEKCGDRVEQTRLNYEDLQRFNDFLTEICVGILRIRERPESDSLEQAAKQKDIILLILDTYVSERFCSVQQLEVGHIEYYKDHKAYYDNLDFSVALLFFDNIFLLKSIMKSPRERLYSELESSFLLSAVTNKYFTTETMFDVGSKSDSINFLIIPFLERLKLRENIRYFCSILREKKLVMDDIVKRIPQKEISEMLSNFPELKDEFLICRLDHYLRTALETESGGMKQKLVIQRALQVIGESINVEKECPSSLRHLLCKCLPEDTFKVLKKARNTLSHLESFQFPLKFIIEQDADLFISIQAELKIIKEALKEVFDIQKIRLMEFLFSRGLELLENIQETASQSVFCKDNVVVSMKNFWEALQKRKPEKKEKKDLLVPHINEFCRGLIGYASRSEKERIRREIPLAVISRVDAIKKLEQDLEEGIVVDEKMFDLLFLNKKDLCQIKKEYEKYSEEKTEPSKSTKKSSFLRKIRKCPNPLNILELIFEKKQISDSQSKILFDSINFSEEAEATLNSLIEISKGPCGDNLANLLNRVKHLYQISIDEQFDIRYLWEKGKSPQVRQFIAYKIVQRYFRDSSFQASLEMLLFDCVAILKNNEDFNSFWMKTSYLFNGIDVRNVLAHGDPLLESIGDMLDPKDLPSELVKKMLQLFDDRDCIEDLCELWQKAKLKENIVCCGRWQEYSKLLAEGQKEAEASDAIVAFLEKKPAPKIKKPKNRFNST